MGIGGTLWINQQCASESQSEMQVQPYLRYLDRLDIINSWQQIAVVLGMLEM